MDATSMAQQIMFQQWAKDCQDYLDSGLSQKKWCEQNGIKQTTFSYRYRRLRQISAGLKTESSKTNLPVAFAKVPVAVNEAPLECSSAYLHINYEDKRIDIPKDIPIEYFQTLLEVLFNAK